MGKECSGEAFRAPESNNINLVPYLKMTEQSPCNFWDGIDLGNLACYCSSMVLGRNILKQDPYRVEDVLPKTTEIVHNMDEMRSIIGHNTDSERTATSENKIQFRSVNDGDKKLLSEDAARNHARELVLNQDIIISETPILA